MITWSYTRISDWLQCPYKFQQKHILKTAMTRETPAMLKGKEEHAILEAAVKGGNALPSTLSLVKPVVDTAIKLGGSAELALGVKRDWSPCGFWDKECWGRCKIDVIVKDADKGLIIDWKTGKTKNKKYMTDMELKLHALIAKAHFPQLKVISAFYVYTQDGSYWPEGGKPYQFWAFKTEMEKVDEMMGRVEFAIANDRCGTRKNNLCPWCEVLHCKHCKPKEVRNGFSGNK